MNEIRLEFSEIKHMHTQAVSVNLHAS